MFEKQQFIKSAFNNDEIVKDNFPQVVLCGRSNVGKSSFINSLFNRKNLAKISSTPGKTRSVNYYLIDDNFYIVDLPGYGYAKANFTERKKWAELVNKFFSSSDKIKLVIHLVDSRHKPTELDIQLNKMLGNYDLNYIILLSKSDKLKQSERKLSLSNLMEVFPDRKSGIDLFFYSSIKGTGKKEIKKTLSQLFY